MATIKQPQTKIIATEKTSKYKKAEDLAKVLGRPLGSPINSKQDGDEFDVTLTGDIQIREFNGVKGAYYLTKEGYSIKVNASFNPAVHGEGKVLKAVCRTFAREEGGSVKFCALVD